MANTPAVQETKTLVRITDFDAAFAKAAEEMRAPDVDPKEMLLRILNAVSLEEILGDDSGALGMDAYGFGKPMVIKRAELRASDFTQGLAAYATLFVSNDNGDDFVVNCGASTVIAQLIAMHQREAFPVRCMCVKASKATKSGYFPLSLTKAPDVEEPF